MVATQTKDATKTRGVTMVGQPARVVGPAGAADALPPGRP
jgi:hypothetical protein